MIKVCIKIRDDWNLLSQDDDQAPEDTDEVNEQVQGVSDKVLVTSATLLNDQLSVVQDESTHQQETKVQVGLGKTQLYIIYYHFNILLAAKNN